MKRKKGKQQKSFEVTPSSDVKNEKGMGREIILIILTCGLTLGITKGCEYISNWSKEEGTLNGKIDNLYMAIVIKHGKPNENLIDLNSSRLEKIKSIKNIQMKYHLKSYTNLEKLLPTLEEGSSIADWEKAINAYTQIEKLEHKDFQIAQATAFWNASLNFAKESNLNPMAMSRLYLERPALELAASQANLKINIEEFGDKNVEGILVGKDKIKFIPADYPVISTEKQNTIFIPSFKSLESIQYFEAKNLKSDEPLELQD